MDNLIGQVFAGYEIKSKIGAGGMASIYKGYDETLSRWVAIKLMPAQVSNQADETLLKRFRLEAQSIARLRHPNILTIYGYGEQNGWAYITMEFVPDGSLEDHMKQRVYTWEEAFDIIIPVADALTTAHQAGIIHRDIKPANILMSSNWPLLADFGLVKIQDTGSAPGLTMPGQVLGTMAYAAPEQIEEGEIDTRVDIYSLGVVLYELLTEKLPFEGETSFDFLMARLTDPPIPLLKANPQLPPVLAPVLERALEQSPHDRFQSMADFIKAIEQARQQARQGTPTTPLANDASEIRLRLAVNNHPIFRGTTEQKTAFDIGRAHKTSTPDIELGQFGGARAGVSRLHARILHTGGVWHLEDLGSTNGTFINGTKVPSHQMRQLKSGDVVRCGQLDMIFDVD